MRAGVNISAFQLNDGTSVSLPTYGVVLIVGPNNAGKSQFLRDIATLVSSPKGAGVVVSSASIDHRGSTEDLRATFQADRAIVLSQSGEQTVGIGRGGRHPLSTVLSWWNSPSTSIVDPYFLLTADTESRLSASKPVRSLDLYEKDPTHAIQRLYENRDIETLLDRISREAFGKGMILDTWSGGDHWALRVGEIEPPNSPRPTQEFLDALKLLPLLHEQGDGVRSMTGLLLELLTGHQTVALLDEPEAFLHPPQARYLAKVLSETADRSEGTSFLSTHSSDVVHGTLEGPAHTTVVRLVRRGNTNFASVLDNEAVRRLWDDPLLRYSNLLEGLFTDAVIVCESDADCKFFASMRDSLALLDDETRQPDVLFTSVGGKHRMHVAVTALRASSVPVAVIGDFDVLNDWAVLSKLIASAGGDIAEFEFDWKTLNSALTQDSRNPSVAGMKAAIDRAFEDMTDVSPKSLAPVRSALRIENGWDRVKNTGLSGLPKGEPTSAADRLLSRLRELNIHLIPVGEMEDFVPSVGNHGPAWLAELLERRLHQGVATDGSRTFFKGVIAKLV
jgi:ABC-type cobalamin/Fe3+-siderophores transport system ATPase subunit